MSMKGVFNPEVDFCPSCGGLLPNLKPQGDISCVVCTLKITGDEFKSTTTKYTVSFNKLKIPKKKQEEAEGPVLERTCPKCSNNEMSFATLQLRSADEGQTVFFTCTKCGYKETENS
ncbi:DNA-directed RNA polymerase I subunit RPA12-like [Eurytemora carolleeae]|uniref:DNA-directed RNA polymerase I subunit RPA12-like n=1 Tax=Eurytemora carolleeae TaxID=1294199 RepID=UPI000C775D1A|nr:DNA-directed RNA polymerase I subunit RPA12-like [Eurytemora carolleeae]|eukprot:XP_023331987.1 DNA-directed RNA polymerase I subunit RPA12-like [Eurytemora affinis]